MTVRLKDVIQEFAEEVAPVSAAPVPSVAEEGPDSATAAAFVAFADGVGELSELLEAETAAIEAGLLDRLEDFTRRKIDLSERLDVAISEGRASVPRLDAHMGARAAEVIARLDRAVAANTGALAALREAVLAVNRSILAAAEKAASDGVYGRAGHSLRPVELSTAGIDSSM
jgi:hypothetical protein